MTSPASLESHTAESLGKICYADFLQAEFENPHLEWVDGRIVPMAPVTDRHQDVGGWLIALLNVFAEEKKLGMIRYRPFQMKTGPKLAGRSPDILFVSNAKKKRLKRTFLKGPADLVVEIISPDSRGRDRGEKFYEYEKGGIPEYWLIDPEREQAEFYLLKPKRIYKLAPLDADGIFHSKALPGLWINPDWFWARPLPAMVSIMRKWGLIK